MVMELTLAQERTFESLDRAATELSIICRRALLDYPGDAVTAAGQVQNLVKTVKDTIIRGNEPKKPKSNF